MCFKNMSDGHARFARQVDVNVAIRPRIENRAHALLVVADEVGNFRDAFGRDGPENQRHCDDLTRSPIAAQASGLLEKASQARRTRRRREHLWLALLLAGLPGRQLLSTGRAGTFSPEMHPGRARRARPVKSSEPTAPRSRVTTAPARAEEAVQRIRSMRGSHDNQRTSTS